MSSQLKSKTLVIVTLTASRLFVDSLFVLMPLINLLCRIKHVLVAVVHFGELTWGLVWLLFILIPLTPFSFTHTTFAFPWKTSTWDIFRVYSPRSQASRLISSKIYTERLGCGLLSNLEPNSNFPKICLLATFTEGNASKPFMSTESTAKESTGVPTATTASTLGPPSLSVGNHLDIPQSNPNLLSPDVLSQRRGCFLSPLSLLSIK